MLKGTVASAIIGGTASVISGGKFANGAQMGAMQYLLNQAKSWNSGGKKSSRKDRIKQVLGEFKALSITDSELVLATQKLQGMELSDLLEIFPELQTNSFAELRLMQMHKSLYQGGAAFDSALTIGLKYKNVFLSKSAVELLGTGQFLPIFKDIASFGYAELPRNDQSQLIIRRYGEAYFGY